MNAFDTAKETQVLIFQVGQKLMALPLEQIDRIVTLEKNDKASSLQASGVFWHQGATIPWLPLWELCGETSIFSDLDAFAEILPQRRQEHLEWMESLWQSIQHDVPFTKARNPHECAFGRWYYSFRCENYWLSVLLATIKEPHARIHMLADRLLTLAVHGDRAETLRIFEMERHKTLNEVLCTFDLIEAALPQVTRRVAVIAFDGNIKCAFGVDRVLDIGNLPPEFICQNPQVRSGLGVVSFANATISGKDLFFPILDIRLLLRGFDSGLPPTR